MPCGTLTECLDIQYDNSGVAPVLFGAKVDSRIRTSFATSGLVGSDDETYRANYRTFRHAPADSNYGASCHPADGAIVARRPCRSQAGRFLGGHSRTSFVGGYGGPPGGGMQGYPAQGMQGGMQPQMGQPGGMGGGMQQPGMGGGMQQPMGNQMGNQMQGNPAMQGQQQQQMNPNMQGQQQMNQGGQQQGGQGQNGQQQGNNGNGGNNGNDNNSNGNGNDGKGGAAAAPSSSNGKMAAMLGGPAGLMLAGGAVYFLFCRRSGVQTNAGGSSGSEMEDSDKDAGSDSGS